MIIEFTIPGEPTGKARPRITRNGRAYTPGKSVNYENWVKWIYQTEVGDKKFEDDVALMILVKAFYPIPKSASKKKKFEMIKNDIRPTKKPDADNILKIVCDALNGIAYHDDKQIVCAKIEKLYSLDPRVNVYLREM